MMYLLVIPMTLAGAIGAFFFKKASGTTDGIKGILVNPKLYMGGLFYVIGAILNIILLHFLQYSVLYPMTAITYIWTALLSNKFLGERISRKKIGGIGLICVGVFLLTR